MTSPILVTGGTGFIGQHLIKRLLEQNREVHVLLRNPDKSHSLDNDVIIKFGDLTNPASLYKACQGIDTIYHLAGFAHANQGRNPQFNEQHHLINFIGTKHLISAAELTGVKKFIFFSSSKAVGYSSHCINETWEASPESAYGKAKRQAEDIILKISQRAGMHATILRPALVYGPSCKGNLYDMLRAIDKGFFIPIPPLHNRRSMISYHDICSSAILAANNPDANGKIYFVTDGKAYSTYQLYEAITLSLGKKLPRWGVPLVFFKLLGQIGTWGEKILRRELPINSDKIEKLFGFAEYDSTRIERELGFKAKYDLSSILPEIITAYRYAQTYP